MRNDIHSNMNICSILNRIQKAFQTYGIAYFFLFIVHELLTVLNITVSSETIDIFLFKDS